MYIYRERVYQAVFKRLLWSDCKFLSLFHHLCNIDDLRSLALEVFFFFLKTNLFLHRIVVKIKGLHKYKSHKTISET